MRNCTGKRDFAYFEDNGIAIAKSLRPTKLKTLGHNLVFQINVKNAGISAYYVLKLLTTQNVTFLRIPYKWPFGTYTNYVCLSLPNTHIST